MSKHPSPPVPGTALQSLLYMHTCCSRSTSTVQSSPPRQLPSHLTWIPPTTIVNTTPAPIFIQHRSFPSLVLTNLRPPFHSFPTAATSPKKKNVSIPRSLARLQKVVSPKCRCCGCGAAHWNGPNSGTVTCRVQGFPRKSDMTCHYCIHINKRNFACRNCGKTFI